MKWGGKWHPLAERFPMLDESELREMAASIAARGQFVPCRMSPNGLGLDGRNRVAACALAEVAPRWEAYDGDPVAFIVEVNAERRHLTTGQRAMAVAIGLAEAGKRRNGRFERGAVPANSRSSSKAWAKSIAEAGLVLDHAPELADRVLGGDLALDAAHKTADEIRRQGDRVKAIGGDLAKLVDNGVITLDEAERRADDTRRLDALDDDLAERVSDGGLALDEAEVIASERAQRMAAWAEKVREALAVLARMAGSPVPGRLLAHFDDDERGLLAVVLDALPNREDQ